MSKLIFRYAVMNSGKSLNLISTAYSFKERMIPYLIMKSSVDTRDSGIIKSRALNTEVPCTIISADTDIYIKISEYIRTHPLRWILIDEAQFLTPEQVDDLASVVDTFNIDVICYGLRTDFQTHLFPGSKRLFEIADKFEEMKSTCKCGNRASVNCRIDPSTNTIISTGSQIDCGSEDKYITLCRSCYNKAIAQKLTVDKI